MHYRRDIDGLRAVAVGAVVLYHAGLSLAGGGYVGVDIFFVISGFLITSIVAEDIRRGRFSIAAFYERRVRRIFPALFAVLLATGIAGFALLLPRDLKELGQAAVSATLFVSNIYFWRTADYFDGPSHLKPLLHTWSLSVEEQFYIVFPPAMYLIHRWLSGRYVAWLAPAAALSLAASIPLAALKPVATFFLAPSRTWELLLGSLLALGAVAPPGQRFARELEAALGLGCIAWTVATYTDQTVFPGLGAVLPCLGAALIIHAGMAGSTWVGRLLSLRPVVFLGLISYSLYLWHWPLLALARYWAGEKLEPLQVAAVLAAALVVSAVSWRWIEQPFRTRSARASRKRLFVSAGLVMGLAVLAGAAANVMQGFPARFPGYTRVEVPGREQLGEGTCFLLAEQRPEDYAGLERCRTGDPGGRRVLVWGDSFAAHLMAGLRPAIGHGLAFYQHTASGCPPIVGIAPARRRYCSAGNEQALGLIRELRPDVVVLSARWELYLGRPANVARVAETIDRLKALGVEVVLVGQSPSFDFDSPHDFVFRTGQTTARTSSDPDLNHRLADSGAAGFIDPTPHFCSDGRCGLKDGAEFLFFDGGHYSVLGSMRLRDPLLEAIEAVIGRKSR